MQNVSGTLHRSTTIPSTESGISPIELEVIRDEQKKELVEQRRVMNEKINDLHNKLSAKKERNGGLQCYLASQSEERQYLESKLYEVQEKQKIEMHLIKKNLPTTTSGTQNEAMKKNRAAK